jgi:hypothetical protein
MILSDDKGDTDNNHFPRWIGAALAMALIIVLASHCSGCANQGAKLPAPIPVELQRVPGK